MSGPITVSAVATIVENRRSVFRPEITVSLVLRIPLRLCSKILVALIQRRVCLAVSRATLTKVRRDAGLLFVQRPPNDQFLRHLPVPRIEIVRQLQMTNRVVIAPLSKQKLRERDVRLRIL